MGFFGSLLGGLGKFAGSIAGPIGAIGTAVTGIGAIS